MPRPMTASKEADGVLSTAVAFCGWPLTYRVIVPVDTSYTPTRWVHVLNCASVSEVAWIGVLVEESADERVNDHLVLFTPYCSSKPGAKLPSWATAVLSPLVWARLTQADTEKLCLVSTPTGELNGADGRIEPPPANVATPPDHDTSSWSTPFCCWPEESLAMPPEPSVSFHQSTGCV